MSRHRADLGKTILSEVSTVNYQAIVQIMNLIGQGEVAIAQLIVMDPKLAITVGLTLAAAYVLIFKTTSGFLAGMCTERVKADQECFTAVSEPFGGMLLVMLYLMTQSGSFASAQPIIALYTFAGYRLMPALQQLYGASTQLCFAGPALEALNQDLMSLQTAGPHTQQHDMPLTQAITLNKIVYCYPNADTLALKGISLTVPANIAFGLEAIDIDQAAVECAANIANLHELCHARSTARLRHHVGERGVRHPGSASASALPERFTTTRRYSLCMKTPARSRYLIEQAVMAVMHNLGDEITIILIAHRLSTAKECDTIFLLEKGVGA